MESRVIQCNSDFKDWTAVKVSKVRNERFLNLSICMDLSWHQCKDNSQRTQRCFQKLMLPPCWQSNILHELCDNLLVYNYIYCIYIIVLEKIKGFRPWAYVWICSGTNVKTIVRVRGWGFESQAGPSFMSFIWVCL